MRTIGTVTWIAALVLLAAAVPARAAGGSGIQQGAPGLAPQSPEQAAAAQYNRALQFRNKAWKLEEKAEGTAGAQREKLEAKAMAHFEKAVALLESATEQDPRSYRAFSSLGYALRRLGKYRDSLVAYDRSLALNPNYAEAVEYRAEAYLALDRVADARDALLKLKVLDPRHAAELLDAFETWLRERREDPRGIEPAELDQVAAWLEGQRRIAATTAAASARAGSSW